MSTCLQTISGKGVSPLGLAGNPDQESRFVDRAFEQGISYFFFYNLSFQAMVAGLNRLCRELRDDVFIATGTEDRDVGEVGKYLDQVKRRIGLSFVDLFFLQYVAPSEEWDEIEKALDALQEQKARGDIGLVGATVHNRELALALIDSGKVDVLMHRYNMAHRKCEEKVLPAAQAAGLPVISFTNTRWASLLKGHPKWQGAVPTAPDCYRYVLHHPAVHVALTAPASVGELDENLSALDYLEADQGEIESWQDYGDLVYGDGLDAFETRWP